MQPDSNFSSFLTIMCYMPFRISACYVACNCNLFECVEKEAECKFILFLYFVIPTSVYRIHLRSDSDRLIFVCKFCPLSNIVTLILTSENDKLKLKWLAALTSEVQTIGEVCFSAFKPHNKSRRMRREKEISNFYSRNFFRSCASKTWLFAEICLYTSQTSFFFFKLYIRIELKAENDRLLLMY